jgi:hypothetical protein
MIEVDGIAGIVLDACSKASAARSNFPVVVDPAQRVVTSLIGSCFWLLGPRQRYIQIARQVAQPRQVVRRHGGIGVSDDGFVMRLAFMVLAQQWRPWPCTRGASALASR